MQINSAFGKHCFLTFQKKKKKRSNFTLTHSPTFITFPESPCLLSPPPHTCRITPCIAHVVFPSIITHTTSLFSCWSRSNIWTREQNPSITETISNADVSYRVLLAVIDNQPKSSGSICSSQSGTEFFHSFRSAIFFFFKIRVRYGSISARHQHPFLMVLSGRARRLSSASACRRSLRWQRGGWELSQLPLPTSPRPSVEWRPARWRLRKAQRKRLRLIFPTSCPQVAPSCCLPPFRKLCPVLSRGSCVATWHCRALCDRSF